MEIWKIYISQSYRLMLMLCDCIAYIFLFD